MKAKQFLVLMECILMILVFVLCAAFCMKAFVWADASAQRNADTSSAVLQVQSVAEVVKACQGDFASAAEILGEDEPGDGAEGMMLYFDEDWKTARGKDAVFCITAVLSESDVELLGQAEICAAYQEGEELFSLTVCWQEVA